MKCLRVWAAVVVLAVGLTAAAGCGQTPLPTNPSPVVKNTAAVNTAGVVAIPFGSTTVKGLTVNLAFVEFQYSPGPRWFYAPLVHLSADPGAAAALTSFNFAIPGLGATAGFCTQVPVEGGKPVDLFREIYGDYELTLDDPGHRATSSTGTGTFTFVDASGQSTTVNATGPIVPGSLPTTYTGGVGGGFSVCFR